MNDTVTSRKKQATLMRPTSPHSACFSIILPLYYLPAHNVQYEISTAYCVARYNPEDTAWTITQAHAHWREVTHLTLA
jgi:hypothetical protein